MRDHPKSVMRSLLAICLVIPGLLGLERPACAAPAQVLIIRHAEKPEDLKNPHLSAIGRTRALALSEFFRSDPRVLKHGPVAAIIAQQPLDRKKSVRCVETVQPLAQALGIGIIDRFQYGQAVELAEWLKSTPEFQNQSVLISAWHLDIVPLVRALGVDGIRQPVWPHETYDRVWILNFSPVTGAVESFQDIPQDLLFGDSFQSVSAGLMAPDVQFSQVYSAAVGERVALKPPPAQWKTRFQAQIPGDFSRFDDATIPMLRLGGFTFGYHATSLGKLRTQPNAWVETDSVRGTGSLRYEYQAKADGVLRTYATVRFSWSRDRLTVDFDAEVDENQIEPEIDMPVEAHGSQSEGRVQGAINAYVAFDEQRFFAPAGLPYSGIASCFKRGSGGETCHLSVQDAQGVLVPKAQLPEL